MDIPAEVSRFNRALSDLRARFVVTAAYAKENPHEPGVRELVAHQARELRAYAIKLERNVGLKTSENN